MNPRKALLAVILLTAYALVQAADLSEPVLLVAAREMNDRVYGSTILIAAPLPGGQHFGFILNRPTRAMLGKMYPDHGPSQKIVEPVYLGGPFNLELLFALVQRPDSPGGNSIEMLPGLYAAFEGEIIDRVIETQPEKARFVAGMVAWAPGELQQEVKRGLWHVLEPDAALVLRRSDGLWEELLQRVERAARGI